MREHAIPDCAEAAFGLISLRKLLASYSVLWVVRKRTVKATPTSLRHRGDIPELTGLRFLAAFSVMAAHGIDVTFKTTSTGHLFGLTKFWLSTAAGIGMPLFFVLQRLCHSL